jgi:hypothetical protein
MMEINNNVITFKSLPEFFDKEKTGIKNSTYRHFFWIKRKNKNITIYRNVLDNSAKAFTRV